MTSWVWPRNGHFLDQWLLGVSQSSDSVRAKNIDTALYGLLVLCLPPWVFYILGISLYSQFPQITCLCKLFRNELIFSAVFKDFTHKCVNLSIFFVQELVQMELKKSRDILFFLLLTGMWVQKDLNDKAVVNFSVCCSIRRSIYIWIGPSKHCLTAGWHILASPVIPWHLELRYLLQIESVNFKLCIYFLNN